MNSLNTVLIEGNLTADCQVSTTRNGKEVISFLKAKRISFNSVEATYTLDGNEFTVEWNNIHPGTGELGDYDLQLNTRSLNNDLAVRVDDAIREGETDDNPDLELYLIVRDTFDSMDCAHRRL